MLSRSGCVHVRVVMTDKTGYQVLVTNGKVVANRCDVIGSVRKDKRCKSFQ